MTLSRLFPAALAAMALASASACGSDGANASYAIVGTLYQTAGSGTVFDGRIQIEGSTVSGTVNTHYPDDPCSMETTACAAAIEFTEDSFEIEGTIEDDNSFAFTFTIDGTEITVAGEVEAEGVIRGGISGIEDENEISGVVAGVLDANGDSTIYCGSYSGDSSGIGAFAVNGDGELKGTLVGNAVSGTLLGSMTGSMDEDGNIEFDWTIVEGTTASPDGSGSGSLGGDGNVEGTYISDDETDGGNWIGYNVETDGCFFST